MDFSIFGLMAILAAWLWQFSAVMKGKKNLQSGFLLLYMVGVIFLVWNGFATKNFVLADWLNGAVAVLVGILLLKTGK